MSSPYSSSASSSTPEDPGHDPYSLYCLQCLNPATTRGIIEIAELGLELGEYKTHNIREDGEINLWRRSGKELQRSASSGCAFCGLLTALAQEYYNHPEHVQITLHRGQACHVPGQ
jgi:hypothetical protein